VFAAIYMPFLPNRHTLALALIYAGVCVVVLARHMRQGFREAAVNPHLAAEFRSAGVMRRPTITLLALSLLIGGLFGFLSASYLLAGGYTRLVGRTETQQFTVTSSFWSNSRKYGQCFDTQLDEQARVFQVFRAVCLRTGHKAGDLVVFSGRASWLGFYLEATRSK
jgi:hypothetical protein